MSVERYEGGLSWSPLFSASKNEISEFLRDLSTNIENRLGLQDVAVRLSYHIKIDVMDEDVLEAIKRVIFKYTLEFTSFAKDVLSEDEHEKAFDTYKREQFNSNALNTLLNYYLCACVRWLRESEQWLSLSFLFWGDIKEQTEKIRNKKVEKQYSPLKKAIEKIASGVKAQCYLDSNKYAFSKYQVLGERLNSYLVEKYGYDFNKVSLYSENSFMGFDGKANELLELALLDDKEFWRTKDFNAIVFINSIYKNNSEKHARKVLDYIFSKITSNRLLETLMDNGLSIGLYDKQSYIDTYSKMLTQNGYSTELMYPLVSVENEEEKCSRGKEIFESFLYGYVYPNNKEIIEERLRGKLNTPVKKLYTIFGTLNFIVTGLNITEEYARALEIVCPQYFAEESLWKRVYLKTYEMSLRIEQERLYSFMFEDFYNLFAVLEWETGIETAIQLDLGTRNAALNKLKELLKSFDIEISDKMELDYIASLLDRKSAKMTEAERFPVLEQLGDAIYGFAVAEMIFYNPDYDDYADDAMNPKQRFENYISAKGQIKIVEKYNIDQMYISASSVLGKNDERLVNGVNDYNRCGETSKEIKKYLADTLEMILGAVALDKGYDVAIDLAKKMIRETFKGDFPRELHYSCKAVVESKDVDRDYWMRIRPGIHWSLNELRDVYNQFMIGAFYKLMACIVFKTEGINERRKISHVSYDLLECFDVDGYLYSISPAYYCYLTEGLYKAVEAFGERALKKYKEKNK